MTLKKKTVDRVDRSAEHKELLDMVKSELGPLVAEALDAHIKSDNENDRMGRNAHHEWTKRAYGLTQDPQNAGDSIGNPWVKSRIGENYDKATGLARWFQYAHACKGDAYRMFKTAEACGDEFVAKAIERRCNKAAMGFADLTGGGSLIPIELMQPVIDELMAESTVLTYPVSVEDLNGFMQIPFVDSGATANWVGEGNANNASPVTTGQLNLRPYTMLTQVPVNRLWLEKSGSSAFLMNHVKMKAQEKLDSTLLRSLGTANQPLGLRGLVKTANQLAMTGSPDASTTQKDLLRLQRVVWDGNINPRDSDSGYIFAPRTEQWLKQQTATTGNPIFLEEMVTRGTLYGIRYMRTSQIPTNLGGGSNESEVYFFWAPGLLFAPAADFRGEVIDNAAYKDASGNVVAGASQFESLISMVFSCDFADLYRGASISELTGVTWGA